MEKIFLTEEPNCVPRVYSKEILERLKIPPTVYRKSDILGEPQKFKDVKVIFSTWGMPAFTKEEVKSYLPALQCIFYAAGTVKFFARGFLEAGVRVFGSAAANAIPVAETAAAQIVLANKGFFQTARVYQKEQYAASRSVLEQCAGNYDTNVGIIGVGRIGKEVVRLLKNYRLNLYAYDPFLPEEKASELGVTKCDLQTLFKTCVTVSNHLADKQETRGMLTKDLFLSMPPYAAFLNTGRGAQVVESDLIEALRKRPDLTAILDVTDPEPVPCGNRLYSLENCILTPHIAGSQNKEVRRMAEFMLEEYENFLNGLPPRYEITLDMLQTMA